MRARDGTWWVVAGASLWGTTGTAQALAPPGATPLSVGAVRLALGSAALVAWAAYRGSLQGFARRGGWPPVATAVAVVGMAAYQPFFFTGVARTGVAVGTIVGIGSSPVWAGALGWLVRGERPGAAWAVATGLAVGGVTLLLSGGSGQTTGVDAAGVAFALGAGLSYAAYVVASKALLDRNDPNAVAAVVFTGAAVALTPLLPMTPLEWVIEPRGALVMLHLGLVATGVSYVLFTRGLAGVPVAKAGTLSLAEPTVAGLLGIAFLGERPSVTGAFGLALVLAGLAVLAFHRRPVARAR